MSVVIEKQRAAQVSYLIQLSAEPVAVYQGFYRQRSMAANYALRYQLAFTGYALAVAAWADPASRETTTAALRRVIDRLIERPVWEYWAKRGGSPDPVYRANIMYSGHLAHLMGLSEKISRDRRYDEGFDLIWDEQTRFPYTHSSLVECIHSQMVENAHHGVTCEPGMVYVACNNHAAIANLLHDQTHGTDLARVNHAWLEWAERTMFVRPKTLWPRGIFRAAYSERHRMATPISFAILDAWGLLFLAAFRPEIAARLYPRLQAQLKRGKGGGLRLAAAPFSDRFEIANESLNTAFAYAVAREVGDRETADRLREQLDATAGPVEREGQRWYADCRPAALVTALVTLGDYLEPGGLAALTLGPVPA